MCLQSQSQEAFATTRTKEHGCFASTCMIAWALVHMFASFVTPLLHAAPPYSQSLLRPLVLVAARLVIDKAPATIGVGKVIQYFLRVNYRT